MVTGHDRDGKAVFASDQEVATAVTGVTCRALKAVPTGCHTPPPTGPG